jgi:hypothetical protein
VQKLGRNCTRLYLEYICIINNIITSLVVLLVLHIIFNCYRTYFVKFPQILLQSVAELVLQGTPGCHMHVLCVTV